MAEAKVPIADVDESNYEKLESQFEEVSLFIAPAGSSNSSRIHSGADTSVHHVDKGFRIPYVCLRGNGRTACLAQ